MAQSINFDGSSSISNVGGSTSLTPAPVKSVLQKSYLGSSDYTFAQQYLPDLYEKEFEKYGNRSVASFLRMVSAELPCSSDLIKWSEQGRLHILATGTVTDGNTLAVTAHKFRNGQTIIIKKTDGTGPTLHAIVTDASAADAVDVACLNLATLVAVGGFSASDAVSMFVYGSEFKKGTNGMDGSYDADFAAKENNPIILKEKYEVSGSELAHIGWVEVTTENGASGYLWYLKSEHESRLRFEDYMELAMVEGVPAADGSAAASAGFKGTKGLFYEVENNGLSLIHI